MAMDNLLLKETKVLIEEIKKPETPRSLIDRCFRFYNENIGKKDILYSEKVFLCILNGLTHMKNGSHLSAEGSYLLAKTFAYDSENNELLKEVGFEIMYFFVNSKEWMFKQRSDLLIKVVEIGLI